MYNRQCLEHDFKSTAPQKLQCHAPAYPGDSKCRASDRIMNQFHNEFIRLQSHVELGDARRLIMEPDRLRHFMLRSRELVALESGACSMLRLKDIKNPFLSPEQCRQCISEGKTDFLNTRDFQVVESRRLQLMQTLHGLRMKDGKSVEHTVAEIVCSRLEKKHATPQRM